MNKYLNFIKGLLILSFTHESPYHHTKFNFSEISAYSVNLLFLMRGGGPPLGGRFTIVPP